MRTSLGGPSDRRFGVTPDLRLLANPFTDKFWHEEIEFYDLRKPYKKNGIEVRLVKPGGQLDDYLNRNWRLPKGDFKVPVLYVDDELWMSLTPMEIQSTYLPITLAHGEVGTAGLGLGYFTLRAAGMKEVEKIQVFEKEPRVVDFFMERFGDRPEMEKIEIIIGDARREMLWTPAKRAFDYVFMDVYQTMLSDDVLGDILLFNKKGAVEEYRFWGQERVVLDAHMAEEDVRMSWFYEAFFRTWQSTKDTTDPRATFMLQDMYQPTTDEAFRKAVFDALGDA